MAHDQPPGNAADNHRYTTHVAESGGRNVRKIPSHEPVEFLIEGQVHRLEGLGPWTIGRSKENQVVIPESHVSRLHARVSRDGNDFVVEDLGSANGTLIDGQRIERESIHFGDEFDVGGTVIGLKRGTASNETAGEKKSARLLPDLPGIDGMRALAVIAVLIYHAGAVWLPGGLLGVEIFFVISGYLITALLLGEWRKTGRIDLKSFWLRRARRLLPALYFMIAVTLAYCVAFLPGEVSGLRNDALAAFGYVMNWYLIFGHESYFEAVGRPSLLQHLWSLAIEEQFYLLWPPLLAAGMAIWGRPKRRMIILSLTFVCAIASGVLMAFLYTPNVDPSRLYYGTDTRASGLLLGAALAFVWWPGRFRKEGGNRLPLTLDVVGIAALAGLILFCALLDEYQPFLYKGGFLAVDFVTVFLIAATVHPRSRFGARVLGCKPLRWIGLRSYGIYLWHWPIFMVSRPGVDVPLEGPWLFAARLTATVLLADLSYRFVETPIRRGALGRSWRSWREARGSRKRKLGRRWIVAILAGVVYCTALGVAVALAEPPKSPSYLATKEIHTKTPVTNKKPEQTVAQATTAEGSKETTTASTGETTAVVNEDTQSSAPADTKPFTGSVSAFGDSVLLGAADQLQNKFSGIGIDAKVGLQAQEVINLLKKRSSEGQLGEAVVIHIGNNGVITPHEFDEIMSIVGDTRKVVFINDRVPRSWEEHNNQILAEGVHRYPNAVLADWYDISAGHQEYFWGDGIHLRPEGEVVYTNMISDALSSK